MRVLLIVLLIVCTNPAETLSFPWSRRVEQPAAEGVTFQLAKGWRWISCENIPEVVLSATNRRGYTFPPSINLIVDEVQGSAAEYFAQLRESLRSEDDDLLTGVQCCPIGELTTGLGPAELTIVEATTTLGPMRALQAICLCDNKAYLLTAAAHSDDFGELYDSFLKMIASLQSSG